MILPCPECEAEVEFKNPLDDIIYRRAEWSVMCPECKTRLDIEYDEDEDDEIHFWLQKEE